jgi:hypothetical protein
MVKYYTGKTTKRKKSKAQTSVLILQTQYVTRTPFLSQAVSLIFPPYLI